MLLLIMAAVSAILDAIALILLFSCEFIHLYLVSLYGFPVVVVFAALAMLAMNIQLLLAPFLKSRYTAPILHWLNTVAIAYFILQFLVIFGTGFLSPVLFTVLSLLLMMFYIVAVGLISHVSGAANTWGKSKPPEGNA